MLRLLIALWIASCVLLGLVLGGCEEVYLEDMQPSDAMDLTDADLGMDDRPASLCLPNTYTCSVNGECCSKVCLPSGWYSRCAETQRPQSVGITNPQCQYDGCGPNPVNKENEGVK